MDFEKLKQDIKNQAHKLGFLEANIASVIIPNDAQDKFNSWIEDNYHGEMSYLDNNRHLRFNPQELQQNTFAIISLKYPYLQNTILFHKNRLSTSDKGYISSYALGRDYHKVVKQKINQLAAWINQQIVTYKFDHQYRAFTDSAPVMEVQLATQAGSGWRGKNTLLINKNHGSMFFLGELFTNLPLTYDKETSNHCGSCSKCLKVCPTEAFIAPYVLDARKCISYLTIENKGTIPVELREKIGNRIYGCDDCQLFCPWNKFSYLDNSSDFRTRNNLDDSTLLELFSWNEEEFKKRMQGSAIYRIGYKSWTRNLAIGIGNAPYNAKNIKALEEKMQSIDDEMVKEHLEWAILHQQTKIK